MSVYLAATWNPRGELGRFQRLLPFLDELYPGMVVTLPPAADPQALRAMQELGFVLEEAAEGATELSASSLEGRAPAQRRAVKSPEWSWGRYLALQKGLHGREEYIQYADMDRLIRWAETRPEELRRAVRAIEGRDCLIFGRTEAAYRTHPLSLVQTEAISNRVLSLLLGRRMDISAGSKGFSRRAAEFIIANSEPRRALGTDAEWPVLLYRGGYPIHYLEMDGLDWESADRYQEKAAGMDDQRLAAEAVDQDPRSWARRVEIAMEIVESGLDSFERELTLKSHA
jgi:hypothetical protein